MKSVFSTRFLNLRKEHNLTQKEAAQAMGLSTIGIQGYESCRRRPTFDALIQIADFFNVSTDYLLGRTNNPVMNQ